MIRRQAQVPWLYGVSQYAYGIRIVQYEQGRGYMHAEGRMSESISYTPFYSDPRGNRLERWEVASIGSGHVLRLRGPIEVMEQVQAVAPEYQTRGYRASTVSEWTHELSSPDPTMKREVRQLLELLASGIQLIRRVSDAPAFAFL